MQIHGAGFGHFNFGPCTPELSKHFRVVDYDMRGYGQSDRPVQDYDMEVWADDLAGLMDALEIPDAHVHGTSMGGMIAIAFAAKYPERTIAACADCAFARCDVYRRTMFRSWRKMAEAMPLDDFCDLLTIQAVSADFIEANPDIFDTVRRVVAKNSPYTVRQACLAMETMDLESLARTLQRPILFTNGTRDIMTPPDLAPSGFSARQIVAAVPEFARLHEFPQIGHADLLEVPTEAVEVVGAFFQEVLAREDAAVAR